MHQKVLTMEKLAIGGVYGASLCTLCFDKLDYSSHIFLNWPSSKVFWSIVLQDICFRTQCPTTVEHIHFQLPQAYLGTFKGKPFFKRIWLVLPSSICWKILLARNRGIFQGLQSTLEMVISKYVGLLLDYFNSRKLWASQLDAIEFSEIKGMEGFPVVIAKKISTTFHANCYRNTVVPNTY